MAGSETEFEIDDVMTADAQLMARICWYYFKEGQTQEAVAQRLGLTRKRVNRMLNDARASGFVQISINSSVGAAVELESQLLSAYGLRKAIVVPAPASDNDLRAVIGAAAGRYVSENLGEGESLGISWGGTINAAAQNVIRRQGMENSVVLMCGGLAQSTRINPYDNAASFAKSLDATCYYITAPMYAETQSLAKALMESDPIQGVLERARGVNMALLSAIDLSEQSKALEYGVVTPALRQELLDAGAVGDVCGHYLDSAGRDVAHPINGRTIHIPLQELRELPQLILAAGGLQKVDIIRAAINARLCHVLVTDETTARALLRPSCGDDGHPSR